MTIPTPAAVKKTLDEKRAKQPTPQESNSKGGNSTVSHSSRKGKGQVTSNRSKANSSSSNSTRMKSIRKRSTSSQDKARTSSLEASATTEVSPPKISLEKKPFVRPEHLTQRPLLGNEALLALKQDLEGTVRTKRRPVSKQSRMNNKENN